MRIFMTKAFRQLYKKAHISKPKFDSAIKEIFQGLSSPLGHKLHKKRIASQSKGKSGSYRAILYYRIGKLIIFFYLFPKGEKENIDKKEKREFAALAE